MYHANESKSTKKASCKYLGLYIDYTVTFRDHINYILKK